MNGSTRLHQAAAQNLGLQDQIGNLQYKLDMIAKARQSGTEKPAAPTQRDEKDKPKTKEAEVFKLNN